MKPGGGNPVVVMHLMGGLGNQMFQYAFGRRMALANSAQLVLDASGYASAATAVPERGVRVLGLAHFRIVGSLMERAEPASGRALPVWRWIRKARVFVGRLGEAGRPYFLRRDIIEPAHQHFRFDRDVYARKVEGVVSVRGFWQTEAYFLEIEDTVRRELTLRDELRGKNAELASRIRQTESVAIHVRHGDNANAVAAELGVLPRDYYTRAVQELANEVREPHFFVFSDDIEWTKQLLGHQPAFTFVDHNGAERSHEDMRLISLCKHHVLANSTFGWWGAWLAKSPDQIVIAPCRYYLGIDRPNPDLYPRSWRLR